MNTSLRLLNLSIGSLFCALAINAFLAPNNLLSGGVGGISILLNHVFKLNIGIIILLINIPLFALAYKKLNKTFVFYSLINMVVYSFLTGVTSNISQYISIQDPILIAIFGGILNGIGMAITFLNKGSQGGTDIIAALVKKKWNMNLGTVLMGLNLIIVAIGSLVFGVQKAMYTLIAMYIAYQVVDKVQASCDQKKSAMVISDCSEEISQDIINEMGRGVTFLQGEGGYSKESTKVIYTIVKPIEIPRLKQIIEKHDKNAFISVNEISEVRGRGFKESFI